MQNGNSKTRKYIQSFNPDVVPLELVHQDFSLESKLKMCAFNAGKGYENFEEFIAKEAISYQENGDGVTYIVWNYFHTGRKSIDPVVMIKILLIGYLYGIKS